MSIYEILRSDVICFWKIKPRTESVNAYIAYRAISQLQIYAEFGLIVELEDDNITNMSEGSNADGTCRPLMLSYCF